MGEGAKIKFSRSRNPIDPPAQTLRIYNRLWQVETLLRDMVYLELKAALGAEWIQVIPKPEIGSDPLSKDKRLTHMRTSQTSPLAFISFGQLWSIILRKDLWRYFQVYFPPRDLLEAKLIELLQIRHRVSHCRHPHPDDLQRLEQFLRDVDKGFWNFLTSYNNASYIDPSEENLIAALFNLTDKPMSRLETHVGRSIRPWVDKKSLERPINAVPGVLYDVIFVAYDQQMIEPAEVLCATQPIHRNCVYIHIGHSCTEFRITIPAITSLQVVRDSIERFRKEALNALRPQDSGDSDEKKAKNVAVDWPEYVLSSSQSHPLSYLNRRMPCAIFDA